MHFHGVLPAKLEHEFYTFTFLKTLQVIHLSLIWIEELCGDPKKLGQPEKRSFSFGPIQMSKETIDDLDVSIIESLYNHAYCICGSVHPHMIVVEDKTTTR